MKKFIKYGVISSVIIALAVCAWFFGYYNRKSQDNLPALESLLTMDEANMNELLVGYRNYQLEDVWGEPDVKSESTWIWRLNENKQLQVNCNNKDKVVICSFDSIMKAKIVEISDGYYLVQSLEGCVELRSSNQIQVPIEHLESSPEGEIGDIVEIVHSGETMDSDPEQLRDVYSVRVVTE